MKSPTALEIVRDEPDEEPHGAEHEEEPDNGDDQCYGAAAHRGESRTRGGLPPEQREGGGALMLVQEALGRHSD